MATQGLILYNRGEMAYRAGRYRESMDFYTKSIKKILKDENVIGTIPSQPMFIPNDIPREVIGIVWRNFVTSFRNTTLGFTEQTAPEAYKLLNSFRPSARTSHTRFERTARGKIVLKGMQITAAFTLALMAWDSKDRATAAKRYKEALDLADTHPPFIDPPPGTVGMEHWVHLDLQTIKENLDIIMRNDEEKASIMQRVGTLTDRNPMVAQRKDVVSLPDPRLESSGEETIGLSYMFASDACGKCGKRDVKLMRCSLCKKMP